MLTWIGIGIAVGLGLMMARTILEIADIILSTTIEFVGGGLSLVFRVLPRELWSLVVRAWTYKKRKAEQEAADLAAFKARYISTVRRDPLTRRESMKARHDAQWRAYKREV